MKEDKKYKLPEKASNPKHFDTPEGYFESLPDRIVAKINANTNAEGQVQSDFKYFWFAPGVAASLAIGWMIWGMLFSEVDGSSRIGALGQLSEVADQDIIEYLEYSQWVHSEALEELELPDMNELEDSILPELEEVDKQLLLEYLEEIG